MTELDINLDGVEPMGEFTPLPLGEYTVMISASERKPTKDGEGEYLQLVLDVLDEGEYHGRKLFDRLNLINKNETAVKMAKSALKAICLSVGVNNPKDTNELHNKPFKVKVGIRPAKGEYGESNTIKAYMALDGVPLREKAGVTGTAPVTSGAGAAAAGAAKKPKPWEAKAKK